MLNEIDSFLSAHANIVMWAIVILMWTVTVLTVRKITKSIVVSIATKKNPVIKKWVVEAEAKKRQKEREQNH